MRIPIAGSDLRGDPQHSTSVKIAMLARIGILSIAISIIGLSMIVQPAFSEDDRSNVVRWIRRAEESGRLQVDFYPPDKRPQAFPGWTDFELTLEYKYDHQTRWKATSGNTFSVTIIPTFTSIKPLVSHAIKLPISIDATRWHESVLGSHELDHVAIGSHPRLIMLATHLVKNIGTLNRNADRVADVTPKWARESITEVVNERRRALQMLVMSNNERLDDLTRHGGKTIIDREALFDRLFLKENLAESNFEYIGESLKLLDTEDYCNASVLFAK